MVEVNRVKHIHTVECSTSSTLCDSVIKHDCMVGQVLQNPKTFVNNSDVDQQSGKTEQDLRVPVLNMHGKPLMPTSPAKARHLLAQNKADVLSRKPFTIQLKYATGETKQHVTLGLDAGYKNVGVSLVSDKRELFSAEITLRTDIPKKLQDKLMYRKHRRSKLWYREPRFNNRGIPNGWLAPSIQHKLDSHIRIVNKLKELFPIADVIVEVASFDIQKIKNPDISGVEYQQGEQLGFWNLREYVLHRDNHTCQHCKGKKKDPILQTHHINDRKEGATNRPEELLTVCKTCHKDHHSGKDIIPKKKVRQFKPEIFMTIVRWRMVDSLKSKHTYGYITKHNRIKQGLPKSHVNDAFVIAGGVIQERSNVYNLKQIRRNNRKLQISRKKFGISIRRKRHALQPNDLIKYKKMDHKVKCTISCGNSIRILDRIGNIIITNIKNVKLICYGKGIVILS